MTQRDGAMMEENKTVSPRARRILVIVLILLLALLGAATAFLMKLATPVGKVASTDEAGGIGWKSSIYGYNSKIDGQLNKPNDVAIAPDGTIWVTDQSRGRILGFGPDGQYKKMLFQGPVGRAKNAFNHPTAVTTDEKGDVFIACTSAGEIVHSTPDNKIVAKMSIPTPLDIEVKGDRIVVGSVAGFAIFTKKGVPVKVVGSRGKGPDQFDHVAGVAIADDGTIFAIDQYNNRLSAYDKNGKRKWIRNVGVRTNSLDVKGSGAMATSRAQAAKKTKTTAKLGLPARITIDGRGRIVVSDPFGFDLNVFDPKTGSLIAKYGKFGGGEGQFAYNNGVDYDPARDVFAVADTGNSRVQLVTIPDSGGSAAAQLRRDLSGRLRALVPPALLLLLLMLLLPLFVWWRRRRNDEQEGDITHQQPHVA